MAKEESIAMANNHLSLDDSKLCVRRGRVESVDLYEIKDTELDELEKGTPAELQLNFAVFLISTAFAAISSLATANFSNKIIETIFIVISVVGVFVGLYLLIAWWRTRSSVKELCLRIRERIPPDPQLATLDESERDLKGGDDPDDIPLRKG
jgi:hypothetical protein